MFAWNMKTPMKILVKKMNKFKQIIILWMVVVGLLFYFNANLDHFNGSFYGIAENNEFVVSYGDLVEIKSIEVVSGQNVEKGQLLIEVTKPGLDQRIGEIQDRLVELESQKSSTFQEKQSLISQLEAQIKAKNSEIQNQIRQIETQYKINKSLTANLKSIQPSRDTAQTNPTKVRINALRKDLELMTAPIKLQIEQLQSQQMSNNNPLSIQIENLRKELKGLQAEKEKLTVYAKSEGVIGMVAFKNGEIVSPYTPILSVSSKTPSYVKGFIHESSMNTVSIHDQIKISTINNETKSIQGEIVGIGSGITEFPERLRKNVEVRLWGREIQVKIPENNHFLLGEKLILEKIK